MHYLRTPHGSFSAFDICQAYMQLEADYNVGGWLPERPSNQRRRESIGCQLARMKYRPGARWVDIDNLDACDNDDWDVRFIYMSKVMQWGLPADEHLMAAIHKLFAPDWLMFHFPNYSSENTTCN